MEDVEDLWLGSNVDHVGDFDDIVLVKQTSDNELISYMVQLKHQETPHNIRSQDFLYPVDKKVKGGKRKKSKEDFSLAKYSKGYTELMEYLKNGPALEKGKGLEVLELLRKTEIVFVLYTNKGVDECDYLKNHDDDELEFLNTSSSQNVVYKFLKNSLKDYDQDFLQKVILFTEQAHVSSVDELLVKEIKELIGSNLTNVDFKVVVQKFLTFTKGWIKGVEIDDGKDKTRTFYSLSKPDIIHKLTDILLDSYKYSFTKEPCTSYESPQKAIWNEITLDKTLTIIESDEKVSQFFKNFIGDTLKHYCNKPGKTWGEILPQKSQKLFSKEHEDLKSQILKLMATSEPTLLDIYKCLWFNNDLPLLLEANDAKGYQDIIKILKLSGFTLRVIIASKTFADWKLRNNPKHFTSLKDLNIGQKEKLFKLNVRLQGRSPVLLQDFVDKSVYEHIKCRDVIYILSGDYVVGYQYKALDTYFIERSFCKVFLNPQVLNEVTDENFLIENLDEIPSSIKNPNLTIATKKNRLKKLAELKSIEATFHRLLFHENGNLEWKESLGSIKNIRNYRIPRQEWTTFNEVLQLEEDNVANKARLLSAGPGMGKSTIMNFLALATLGSVWVLLIDLNSHRKFFQDYQNMDMLELLEYFNEKLIEELKCFNREIAEAVFRKMLHQKKILLLLDGFDEVPFSCMDKVCRIAEIFCKSNFYVWLTTRPVMKDYLEVRLGTVAETLKPFTTENQTEFLHRYFSHVINPTSANHQRILKEFVEKLLKTATANLTDRWIAFTGVPLQTKLLADVFVDDLKASLETGIVSFEIKFDLLYLFEQFIKKKIEILCGKYGEHAKEMRVFYEKHQKFFALTTVFDHNDLAELDIQNQLREFYEDEQKIILLQKDGVAVVKRNLDVSFAHRTFGEFLAAQYLVENLVNANLQVKNTVRHLVKARFRKYYKFLFSIFDTMLSQNFPLHMAVLNKEMKVAKDLIKSNPEIINQVDKGGRTVLHLLTFTEDLAKVDPVDFAQEIFTDSFKTILSIIDLTPDSGINIKDKLDYSALDYAVDNWSPIVADKICQRLSHPSIGMKIDANRALLADCGTFKCRSVFRTLLLHFCSSGLLLEGRDKNESVRSFCEPRHEFPQTIATVKVLNAFIKELEVNTVLELFTFKSKSVDSSYPDYFFDLRFAAAFGTEDNVNFLLSKGVQINAYDSNDHTPLHYAVLHNRLEIVKIFARKGAHINKPDKDGNTALHIALLKGHIDVSKFLISKGANENVPNNQGNTSLHIAAEKGLYNLVSRFISNFAVIDKQNNKGDTALHSALLQGQTETARLLLENDANFELANKEGSSAIHIAAFMNNKEILEKLSKMDVDVNSQNDNGDTPLHLALFKNHVESAQLLLSKGAENKANNDGSFPIHLATFRGHQDVLLGLLAKGADVNSRNAAAVTPLHIAAMQYSLKTLKLLLENGAEVNAQNMCGQTSLHVSMHFINKYWPYRTKYEKTNIKPTAELLFDEGAEVNLQDFNGNTALHNLCMHKISTKNFKTFCADLVTVLLGKGADPNIKNYEEETVVDTAVRCKVVPEIVDLLMEKGAKKSPEVASLKLPPKTFRHASNIHNDSCSLVYYAGSVKKVIRMKI